MRVRCLYVIWFPRDNITVTKMRQFPGARTFILSRNEILFTHNILSNATSTAMASILYLCYEIYPGHEFAQLRSLAQLLITSVRKLINSSDRVVRLLIILYNNSLKYLNAEHEKKKEKIIMESGLLLLFFFFIIQTKLYCTSAISIQTHIVIIIALYT